MVVIFACRRSPAAAGSNSSSVRAQHIRLDVYAGVDQAARRARWPAVDLAAQRKRAVVAGEVAHDVAGAGRQIQLEMGDLGRLRRSSPRIASSRPAGERDSNRYRRGPQSCRSVHPAQGGLARGVGVVIHLGDLSARRLASGR